MYYVLCIVPLFWEIAYTLTHSNCCRLGYEMNIRGILNLHLINFVILSINYIIDCKPLVIRHQSMNIIYLGFVENELDHIMK